MSTNVKSLAARMCAAQAGMTRVKKNGRNDFHGYNYATESDIADACRDAMEENGIGMFYLGVVPESVKAEGNAYSALFRYRFVNTDDPNDNFEATSWGFATDKQDKGPPKAMTSAHKYLLIRAFNIATGDRAIDPDAGGEEPERAPDWADNDFYKRALRAKVGDAGKAFKKPEQWTEFFDAAVRVFDSGKHTSFMSVPADRREAFVNSINVTDKEAK